MVTNDFLLIADDKGLYQVSLDKEFVWNIPLKKHANIHSVAYDPVETRVYWTEPSPAVIKRAYINGSDEESIHQMTTSM